jgi:hypothetical protein
MTAEEIERNGIRAMWDAIMVYVEACGGDTGRVHMEAKLRAVPIVSQAMDNVVNAALAAERERYEESRRAAETRAARTAAALGRYGTHLDGCLTQQRTVSLAPEPYMVRCTCGLLAAIVDAGPARGV